MANEYFDQVRGPGGTRPVRDAESYALATQNAEDIAALKTRATNLETAIENINSTGTWFGCRWPLDSSNSEGTPIGNLSRLQNMQEIFKIGGYMVKNDHTRKKLKKTDHRYYEDDSAVDFSGADGHYQWGWGVGLWYATWEDAEYEYEVFDDKPIPNVPCVYIPVGSRSCAGFAQLDRTNNVLCSYMKKTAQFRGGNNTSSWDSNYKSLLGKPVTNIAVGTLATYARANGSLWFTTERVMIFITGALIRVYFHNKNIQAARNTMLTIDGLPQGGLGDGADIPSDWSGDRAYNPWIDLDAGIELGDYTGTFSVDIPASSGNVTITGIPCFMGLKNFYRYLWTMTEDELLICQSDKSQAYYCEETIDGSAFDMSGAGSHLLLGRTPVYSSAAYSSIKKISRECLSGYPTEVSGTSSTYFADGYYNPAATSGVRGAIRLGSAFSGADAGSVYLSGDLAPSGAVAGGGAVLCEFTQAFSTRLAIQS